MKPRKLEISVKSNFFLKIIVGIVMMVIYPGLAWAQAEDYWSYETPYGLDSGQHSNSSPKEVVAFQGQIHQPGALWLQLHFGDYDLGQHSYLIVTAASDGRTQRLEGQNIARWANASGFFNGDTLTLELFVAPGESGIFFRLETLTVGQLPDKAKPSPPLPGVGPKSLCGADGRVASADPRVGRINGCTAWLTSSGTVLTAGHCVDSDPDQFGPMLPDGELDLNGFLDFNIPPSLANGIPVLPANEDRYPIVALQNQVRWEFEGEGQSLGKDWAVFRVLPNPDTGLTPFQAQGSFFRMTSLNPQAGDQIRITGYGVDNTPPSANRTLQTATGPYVSENNQEIDIWHSYQTDTTGANSGSPIIWDRPGLEFTLGIHTNAGCDSNGNGANSGTSFEHDPLEQALQTFFGPNTVHVDQVSLSSSENGTIFTPYNTLAEGVTQAPSGAIISIVKGSYAETLTIGADGRAMTLQAPVGNVIIGN